MIQEKKVVYLSGAPAAGKSTLLRGLVASIPDVRVFEYGRAMAEKLSSRGARRPVEQEELRAGTEGHVSQNDIDDLDGDLIHWVRANRATNHLVIDSHHVTFESYGFRMAPFSPVKLEALGIDEFWLLALDSSTTRARIERDPKGRRMPSPFQADFHTHLQAGLVSQYAAATGRPLYVFDSSLAPVDLVTATLARFER